MEIIFYCDFKKVIYDEIIFSNSQPNLYSDQQWYQNSFHLKNKNPQQEQKAK